MERPRATEAGIYPTLEYGLHQCGPTVNTLLTFLEWKTGQRRMSLFTGAMLCLSIYMVIGPEAPVICSGLMFFLPAYISFRNIEVSTKNEDSRYLVYWLTFGILCLPEFYGDFLRRKFPIFWLCKFLFLTWCILPTPSNGSTFLYFSLLSPMFLQSGARRRMSEVVTSPDVFSTFERKSKHRRGSRRGSSVALTPSLGEPEGADQKLSFAGAAQSSAGESRGPAEQGFQPETEEAPRLPSLTKPEQQAPADMADKNKKPGSQPESGKASETNKGQSKPPEKDAGPQKETDRKPGIPPADNSRASGSAKDSAKDKSQTSPPSSLKAKEADANKQLTEDTNSQPQGGQQGADPGSLKAGQSQGENKSRQTVSGQPTSQGGGPAASAKEGKGPADSKQEPRETKQSTQIPLLRSELPLYPSPRRSSVRDLATLHRRLSEAAASSPRPDGDMRLSRRRSSQAFMQSIYEQQRDMLQATPGPSGVDTRRSRHTPMCANKETQSSLTDIHVRPSASSESLTVSGPPFQGPPGSSGKETPSIYDLFCGNKPTSVALLQSMLQPLYSLAAATTYASYVNAMTRPSYYPVYPAPSSSQYYLPPYYYGGFYDHMPGSYGYGYPGTPYTPMGSSTSMGPYEFPSLCPAHAAQASSSGALGESSSSETRVGTKGGKFLKGRRESTGKDELRRADRDAERRRSAESLPYETYSFLVESSDVNAPAKGAMKQKKPAPAPKGVKGKKKVGKAAQKEPKPPAKETTEQKDDKAAKKEEGKEEGMSKLSLSKLEEGKKKVGENKDKTAEKQPTEGATKSEEKEKGEEDAKTQKDKPNDAKKGKGEEKGKEKTGKNAADASKKGKEEEKDNKDNAAAQGSEDIKL